MNSVAMLFVVFSENTDVQKLSLILRICNLYERIKKNTAHSARGVHPIQNFPPNATTSTFTRAMPGK